MTNNKLSALIDKQQSLIEDDVRNYIGASSIGSECLRQIWYAYKGVKAEKVPSKIRRTWAIGKHLEGLIIEWLHDAMVLIDVDTRTYHDKNVHIFQGHFDGIVFVGKTKAILEIKTAKDASFKIFIKNGLKAWNPQYYAQVQSYMGMSGIDKTFMLVLNKDNSELSDELIYFDQEFYDGLVAKALLISTATLIPNRINNSPLFYKCKMCKYNKVCHE